jgi:hypothetical protein
MSYYTYYIELQPLFFRLSENEAHYFSALREVCKKTKQDLPATNMNIFNHILFEHMSFYGGIVKTTLICEEYLQYASD